MPEPAVAGVHDASGVKLSRTSVAQLVVVKPLPLVGDEGEHEATPVGPVVCGVQVVTTCVDEFVPAEHEATGAFSVGLVTLQVVVTKLPSVPGEHEATAVGPVVLAEHVMVAQPYVSTA